MRKIQDHHKKGKAHFMLKGGELLQSGNFKRKATESSPVILPSRREFRERIEQAQESLEPEVNKLREQRQTNPPLSTNPDLIKRAGLLIDGFRPGFTGLTTNENQVLDALRGLRHEDLIELARIYEDRTRGFDKKRGVTPGRNLIADLKKELSGFDREEAVYLLEGKNLKADVISFRRECARVSPDPLRLAEILYRNSAQIESFNSEFKSRFRCSPAAETDRLRGTSTYPLLEALHRGNTLDAALEATKLQPRLPRVAEVFRGTALNNAQPISEAEMLPGEVQEAHNRVSRESVNGAAAVLLRAAGAPVARQMRASERVMQAELTQAQADGTITPQERSRIGEDIAFSQGDSAAFKAEKNVQAGKLSTTAAVIVGAASPMMASPLTGAATKVVAGKVLAGTDYHTRDIPSDLTKGAIAGASGAALQEIGNAITDRLGSSIVSQSGVAELLNNKK